MGAHGWIVLLFCGVLFFIVADKLYDAEPVEDRSISYYDDPTKVGILLALFWAVVAMEWVSGWRRSWPGRICGSMRPGPALAAYVQCMRPA